jgi:cytosine/adenosine deaminase-related metal-dependent hydrolase
MSDCGGRTPLSHFAKLTHTSTAQDWIVAHLNEVTETDFDLLRKRKFSIVHCPRSHAYFGHTEFQFDRFRELGFNVCLGTDSLASNDDLNLFAEMRKFHDRFRFEASRVLEMVTINPARALKQRNQLGKIRPDFLADMIALPFTKLSDIFETILNFVGKVPWIMLHGRVSP